MPDTRWYEADPKLHVRVEEKFENKLNRFPPTVQFLVLAERKKKNWTVGRPSLVPQTPPSHEEKRSGEQSRISWDSAHFCDNAT